MTFRGFNLSNYFRKKGLLTTFGLFILLSQTQLASGALKVVTTLPDLAFAASRVGGTQVEVRSLLKGRENPHFSDAVPDYIRTVANADVVCLVGLDLEVGWLPKVLARSGNAKVQTGGKGYCELGTQIEVLERPTGSLDRSMGDVHPGGNPHFWLSPIHLAQGAQAMSRIFSSLDPDHSAEYESNLKKFRQEMESLVTEGKKLLGALIAEPMVMEYHREFSYFFWAYGLRSFGTIEEKPGVPPSAGRLAEVALSARDAKIKVALAADYQPKPLLNRFTEISGVPVVTGSLSSLDYVTLQRFWVSALQKVLKK
jgi:zinc/manganese transport system substrate-binding protein